MVKQTPKILTVKVKVRYEKCKLHPASANMVSKKVSKRRAEEGRRVSMYKPNGVRKGEINGALGHYICWCVYSCMR